ncbi:hypothetical protein PMAYCL1PPCAC_29330, partial [Pristionchus mayeri]
FSRIAMWNSMETQHTRVICASEIRLMAMRKNVAKFFPIYHNAEAGTLVRLDDALALSYGKFRVERVGQDFAIPGVCMHFPKSVLGSPWDTVWLVIIHFP